MRKYPWKKSLWLLITGKEKGYIRLIYYITIKKEMLNLHMPLEVVYVVSNIEKDRVIIILDI